jgi:hypothetical protein
MTLSARVADTQIEIPTKYDGNFWFPDAKRDGSWKDQRTPGDPEGPEQAERGQMEKRDMTKRKVCDRCGNDWGRDGSIFMFGRGRGVYKEFHVPPKLELCGRCTRELAAVVSVFMKERDWDTNEN